MKQLISDPTPLIMDAATPTLLSEDKIGSGLTVWTDYAVLVISRIIK